MTNIQKSAQIIHFPSTGNLTWDDEYLTLDSFPLYACKISAGFPSPADDYLESNLNLNHHLIKHPAATFFLRVEGDSMIGAGIHQGDLLVVDRSLEPTDGKIIIAVLDGDLTVKRLKIKNGVHILMPENKNYPPITIREEMNFSIWGVVTSVIHEL
jgi:DNA polymerase V